MSVRQLIPSLGKELDDLYARVSYLEGMLGVGVPSEADRSCKPCGITWQLGLTCFPQHMAGRRHNKMLMAKQSKNPPQLDQLPKKQKQSITPSNLVSNVRSKPPPLFPPMPPSASTKPSEEGVKRENKSSSSALTKNNGYDRRCPVQPPGTGEANYSPTLCGIEKVLNGVSQTECFLRGKLHNITCMDEYSSKSPEELRWEEYNLGTFERSTRPLTRLDENSQNKKIAPVVDCKTDCSLDKAGRQASASEDYIPRSYRPTMCDLERIINGVLKTDVNKGWLHNITCMDEHSNKSPEELRWEEYINLWRYSEPLKPSLELDQKFEEKSSIFVAGGRTSSYVNKGDSQAAAINGKPIGGLYLGRPEIAVGELSNAVTVQRRDPERGLVDLRRKREDSKEQNIYGERLPITVNGRLVCGEEDELCGHRTSGDSDIISIRPRLRTRIAKGSH